MSRHILLALAALLCSTAIAAAPDCVLCSDQMKKALETCNSKPAGSQRDMCRVEAQEKGRKCEGKSGTCHLDLLLDPPKPK